MTSVETFFTAVIDDQDAHLMRLIHDDGIDPDQALRSAARDYVRSRANSASPWPYESFNYGDALDIPSAILAVHGITLYDLVVDVPRPLFVVNHDDDLAGE